MAREDWRTTVVILIMTTLVLKYFVNETFEHQAFEISSHHIKYHCNWTSSSEGLHQVKQLQDAYKLSGIKELDFSLSMSSFNFSTVKTLLPVRFQPYSKISLNLANNPIGTEGADYILSLIPNGVENLDIAFDSIKADEKLGAILAKRLNNINSLKSLKISLIMALNNNTVLDDFLRFGRLGQKLEKYSLVVIGNSLTHESLGFLKNHLSRAELTSLDLNLYANKIGVEGAEIVADSILSQKHLQELYLDFYFNNITENGTEAIAKSLLEVNNPELKTLHLNLDFNYIKNEGAKAIGKTLAKMVNLKYLTLGVASKNFGYLGFKHIVNGITHLTDLEEFSFKCGINRVGQGGAEITRDLIYNLKKLKKVSLNFYENYVGDEGIIQLTKSIVALENIQSVYLNYGFNDAKGYGLIKVLELLAKKPLKELLISFSSNEFQDSEVSLIKDELRTIISQTPSFEFEFMETAISKRKAAELQRIFERASRPAGYYSRINVNSVITEEQEQKYNSTSQDREEKLQELIEKDKQKEENAAKKDEKAAEQTNEL